MMGGNAASLLLVGFAMGLPKAARAAEPTTPDCLSANANAARLRNERRLRAAREQLSVCASVACPAEIQAYCAEQVAEISRSIPTVVFLVEDGTGRSLSAVKIYEDGQPLPGARPGMTISLDPGNHSFRFDVVGGPSVERTLVITEGTQDQREIVEVRGAPANQAGALPAPASGGWSRGTAQILAWSSLGLGVAGVVVGTIFAVESKSDHDSANSVCPGTQCSDPVAVSNAHDAVTAGNLATAAFVVGGVALAAGVTLWLTAPSASAPAVGVGPGSIQLRSAW